jgi:hypothetical protein
VAIGDHGVGDDDWLRGLSEVEWHDGGPAPACQLRLRQLCRHVVVDCLEIPPKVTVRSAGKVQPCAACRLDVGVRYLV